MNTLPNSAVSDEKLKGILHSSMPTLTFANNLSRTTWAVLSRKSCLDLMCA